MQVYLKVVGLVKNVVTSIIPFGLFATEKTVEVRKQSLPINVTFFICIYRL